MAVSEIRLLVADNQRNVRGNRHRRAFDALNKGDWRTYGAEMHALKKRCKVARSVRPGSQTQTG